MCSVPQRNNGPAKSPKSSSICTAKNPGRNTLLATSNKSSRRGAPACHNHQAMSKRCRWAPKLVLLQHAIHGSDSSGFRTPSWHLWKLRIGMPPGTRHFLTYVHSDFWIQAAFRGGRRRLPLCRSAVPAHNSCSNKRCRSVRRCGATLKVLTVGVASRAALLLLGKPKRRTQIHDPHSKEAKTSSPERHQAPRPRPRRKQGSSSTKANAGDLTACIGHCQTSRTQTQSSKRCPCHRR